MQRNSYPSRYQELSVAALTLARTTEAQEAMEDVDLLAVVHFDDTAGAII